MKRGWFGAALLAALLLLGILSSLAMGMLHEPLSDSMERASELAMAGNWEQAAAVSRRSAEIWEELWQFSAVFADHGPMEEIDSLFAQLEVYRKAGDTLGFAAVCASLQTQLEAMGDAHELSLWNLL